MSVPDKIASSGLFLSTQQSNFGPFVVGSNVYAIGAVDDTGSALWRTVMYKATDPAGTWSAAGGATTQANQPTVVDGKSTFPVATSAVLIGARIYVVYAHVTNGTTVRWFDTSTDTWGTTTATPFSASSANTVANQGPPAVAVNANGDLAVAMGYDKSGSGFNGYWIARCASASLGTLSFASAVQLHSTGSITTNQSVFLVGGAGGRFHGMYGSSGGQVFVTLNTAGTAGTASTLSASGNDIPLALAARDAGAGVIKIRGVFIDVDNATANEMIWVLGDSADSLAPTKQDLGFAAFSPTTVVGTLAYSPSGTVWQLFYQTSTTATSRRTVDDAGTTVSAANAFRASEKNGTSSVATTYTRSATEQIGWVGNYSTTGWAYDEYPGIAATSVSDPARRRARAHSGLVMRHTRRSR